MPPVAPLMGRGVPGGASASVRRAMPNSKAGSTSPPRRNAPASSMLTKPFAQAVIVRAASRACSGPGQLRGDPQHGRARAGERGRRRARRGSDPREDQPEAGRPLVRERAERAGQRPVPARIGAGGDRVEPLTQVADGGLGDEPTSSSRLRTRLYSDGARTPTRSATACMVSRRAPPARGARGPPRRSRRARCDRASACGSSPIVSVDGY